MLVKFSKPKTLDQLAAWSKNAPAVMVLNTLYFGFSVCEIGFSGSNLAAIVEAKATFLGSYAHSVGAVIGYGVVTLLAIGLWAVCLVFFQTLFRNSDDDQTNDAHASPALMGMYAGLILLFSGIMVFLGIKGAENFATDRLAYKAQLVSSADIDSVFAANTAQIRTDHQSEVERLEKAFGAREQSLIAQHRSRRAELTASGKVWKELRQKITEIDSDHKDAMAAVAADKAAAIKEQLDIKNAAMAIANKELEKRRSDVHAHNADELSKAKTSVASYVNGLTSFSMFIVPILLLINSVVGYVMCLSGQYLMVDVPDEYAEGSAIAKIYTAIIHNVGARTHNVAATIYNAAPNKKPMGLPAMIAPPPPPPPMPETKEHLPYFRTGSASDTTPPPVNNSIDLQKALLQYRKHNTDINSRKGRNTDVARSHIEKDTQAMEKIQEQLKAHGYQIVLNGQRKAFEIVKL